MAKRRANGEGSLYQRKDGTWTAQYTDTTGKVRYLYGKTQQEARQKMKEAVRLMDTGVILEPKKVSFSAWIEEWIETYKKPMWRGTTYTVRMRFLKKQIEPFFRGVSLKDVRPEILQKFINEMSENRKDGKPGGYSPQTCNLVFSLVSEALKKAVELDYIPKNPADTVTKKRRAQKEKQVFSLDEQLKIERAITESLKKCPNNTALLLMLHTGMRVGEALGLRETDIDFENNEIHVNRTVGYLRMPGEKYQFYANPPKTKTGKRTIPFGRDVAELLRGQIAYSKSVLQFASNTDNGGYLYLGAGGNVIGPTTLEHTFFRLVKKAGIDKHITLHGLRHTFATRWIESGLDVRSLAEILGHSDIKMTLNTYTHSLPEQRKKSMDAMAKIMQERAEKQG